VNGVEVSYEGRRYSFEPGTTIRIGRSPDNDVVVSEPTVSRQHAHLGYGPDGWVFQGEGRSGTFLRGATVTRLVVRDAVELTLASPQGPVRHRRNWVRRRVGPPRRQGSGLVRKGRDPARNWRRRSRSWCPSRAG